MNNLPILFDSLTRDHPQLTEKALIDFVNGLEVIDDHIRVREQTNNQFIARLWGQFTGASALRQQAIDQNITSSLKTVSTWLQTLQQQHIQSDLALAKVANKLSETRHGVMRLQEKHNALRQDVEKLLSAMDGMNKKYSQLSERLEQIDGGRLATQHIEAVFVKWEAGRLDRYPVVARLFLVFDELYWGDFGNYCRQCGLEHREIKRLIGQVQDKALTRLKEDWTSNGLSSVYDWRTDTRQRLQDLPSEYRDLIAYLSDDATDESMPMLWALNQLANATTFPILLANKHVPIILTAQNVINRFSADFEARYVHAN